MIQSQDEHLYMVTEKLDLHMPNDEITSPFSAQIFDFCDPELFQENLQNSKATSGSNCLDLDKTRSYQDNTGSNTTTTSTWTTNESNINNNNNDNNKNGDLSIIFDLQDEFGNDISASIDFSSSPQLPVSHLLGETGQEQIDFSNTQTPNPLCSFSLDPLVESAGSLGLPVFEEDRLSAIPSYNEALNPTSPSCSFLGTPGLPAHTNINPGISAESSGIFSSSILSGTNLLPQDQLVDYQGDNGGIFCPDLIQRSFVPENFQALGGGECQATAVAGFATPAAPPPLAADISGLDDSTFNKVGKLSVEQRKEKIHRYMKKRNERNFSKKIKYACRKTLADSRPRVRGRFAKNDEFGEAQRRASSSHHDEDDDDEAVVKEEEQMVDSSDIFAHITGLNSFKFSNYSIQSWI